MEIQASPLQGEFRLELEALRKAAQTAPGKLGLAGRAGNVSAEAIFSMAPKQHLVILAQRLFEVERLAARRPGRGDSDFQEFLSLAWQLASGEDDRKNAPDWRRHIDAANAKRLAGRRPDLHLTARLEGNDIARKYVSRAGN